ncbi:MAG: 3-oxoacyl-ACP reductase FabG [Clostridiales bacterium]|jgi:3-oxoacyl-[acyl-carrier protein] reductase|nr:3-oxoacyl-ACP reductase FabG [Clostridiales bacterium]
MEKKTVLITGASRGIGAAAAELFAANGYNAAINYYKSRAEAESLKEKILRRGGGAEIFRCDVSDARQAAEMTAAVKARYKTVDALINNAGIALYGLFTDLSGDDWERLSAVNISGALNVSKSVLPDMISRKSGCIINISSVLGLYGASCEVAYSAVKAALIGFTKALAKEVGPSGIRVNCVAPGVIMTDMNKNLTEEDMNALKAQTSLNAFGAPLDIAHAALFLASDTSKYITGQILSVDGGLVML